MTKLTADMLRADDACSTQVALFAREWPTGCDVTIDNARRAIALCLDLDWAVSFFAARPARRVYIEAKIEARRVFNEATAPAWRAYQMAPVQTWTAYADATAPAMSAYLEIVAVAAVAALASEVTS